jgi:hypothetical protein
MLDMQMGSETRINMLIETVVIFIFVNVSRDGGGLESIQ